MKIKTFEISKYNPEFKTKDGKYLKNEWTSISDIGKLFDDGILNSENYLEVENNYVESVRLILDELKSDYLKVVGLEKFDTDLGDETFAGYSINDHNLFNKIKEGSELSIEESLSLLRLIIRERIWCFLVNKNITIRAGYDFYMTVTINKKLECFNIIKNFLNLFIIEFNENDSLSINDFLDE